MLDLLIADPRVGKIFLEPHLTARLGIADAKVRFQGCRAARHDDHIHLQLNSPLGTGTRLSYLGTKPSEDRP